MSSELPSKQLDDLIRNQRLSRIKERKLILSNDPWHPDISAEMIDLNKEQVLIENPDKNPEVRNALAEVEAHRMEARRLRFKKGEQMLVLSSYLDARAERILERVINQQHPSPVKDHKSNRTFGTPDPRLIRY